jgi:hypothetical protein
MAQPSASPLLFCSAGSVHTAHVARSPVGRDPPARAPLPPCVGHVARPPSDSSSHRPPLKRAPHRDYLLSALTSRRSHLPHLRREPPGRPAAHRSPLVPAAGFRLCGVSPASTPPAWRHPGAPPVVVGSTMPSASPHHAAVERDTATARARAAHGDRTLSAHSTHLVSARRESPLRLGWAARPWPSRLSGRPHVASCWAECRRPWASLRPIAVRRFL